MFIFTTKGLDKSLFKQVTKKLQKQIKKTKTIQKLADSSIGGGETKPMHVGYALVRGINVAMRRAATSGKEGGEGDGEACCWPYKPKKSKFSLEQTSPIGSKNPPKQPEQRKNATTE